MLVVCDALQLKVDVAFLGSLGMKNNSIQLTQLTPKVRRWAGPPRGGAGQAPSGLAVCGARPGFKILNYYNRDPFIVVFPLTN